MKDTLFKVHMFITSFIPLWFSIVLINIWDILEFLFKKLNGKFNLGLLTRSNFFKLYNEKQKEIVFSMLIIIVLIISSYKIVQFLKDINASKNKGEGIIKKAVRANKLGSDFLLAYILPMLVFDFSNLRDIILFIIFMSTLAFLCVRNDNIYNNILLEFLGYKMYNVDIQRKIMDEEKIYIDSLVISKENLVNSIDHSIKCFDFNNQIYINLKKEF